MPRDTDTDKPETATLRSPCPACGEPGIWLDEPRAPTLPETLDASDAAREAIGKRAAHLYESSYRGTLDGAHRQASVELLSSATMDRDRLAAELEVARDLADEWRSGMCSRAELADPANGYAFPWESSGAGS